MQRPKKKTIKFSAIAVAIKKANKEIAQRGKKPVCSILKKLDIDKDILDEHFETIIESVAETFEIPKKLLTQEIP